MIQQLDIVNMALNHLKVRPVSSIDEYTEAAIRAKAIFDLTRDTVLGDSWWTFATYYNDALTIFTDEDWPGWAYLYQIPTDLVDIRYLFIDDSQPRPEKIDFMRCIAPSSDEPAIAVNYEDPILCYTRQVTDPKFWTPIFAECLALKLAAQLAPALTGSNDVATTWLNVYGVRVSEAKRQDGSNKNTEEAREAYRTSTLITARG